jgi:hypothetical protein
LYVYSWDECADRRRRDDLDEAQLEIFPPPGVAVMSLHQSRTRIFFSSLAHWGPLRTALAMLACLAGAATAGAASEAPGCKKEISVATSRMNGLPATIRARVDRGVGKASALFRFHRSDDALARLDALVGLLEGPRGERLQDVARTELTKSIHALRSCLASTEPAPLVAILIRVFSDDGTPQGGRGTPAGEGVYLDVEGIPIGSTARDGTLQANVPSGTIHIRATEYPSSMGQEVVTLSPDASPTVSVVLAEGKEPSEDSDLVLEEAPDDILPANAMSLTLKFVQDDGPVRIKSIEEIALSDAPGDLGESLEQFFVVADGVMHARDPAAVYQRIAGQSRIGRQLSIVAAAIDSEGRAHYGNVHFQIGQFKLAVMLAPPPSNPALPVSNITVRVSVVGTDAAMRRVSDAHGRFEIESLPDATLVFDAHTVASGIHYYTNAMLTVCTDRSVTLLMLNVKDLVAGIPELIIDAGPPACPPVARR